MFKKRNVKIMQKVIASCAAAAVAASTAPVLASDDTTESTTVHWQCSTDAARWVDKGCLETSEWNDADYDELYIDVDQYVRYQTLTDNPWGGCFNERGWRAMGNLTDAQKTEIIENLFGEDGLKLTTGRLPLGNSDFSINNNQSYDELPDGVETDYDMEYFSIDNDREYLLPYINAALKVNPDLIFWASPWSPPSWMKQNKSVPGPGSDNTLVWTSEVLSAYAQYFVNYVKAYADEGLKISWVMPQNEPTINVRYPSCVWSGEQLNEFIRDYLYPAFEKNGIDTEIYLGTFTDSDSTRTDPTLNDPVTSKIIKGLGVQWWSSPLTKRIYKNNAESGYTIIQSETMCGGGSNNWNYVETSLTNNGQFQCLKAFFEAGVNAYMLWNMVLDEKGYNTNPSPWPQNAPVVVNSSTNAVTYTPQYYLFKHFTHYIDGGARRIKTASSHGGDEYGDKIAFQNKDGEIVLEVVNSGGSDYEVCINFNGREIKPTLPAHSINTFTLQGDLSGFDDEDATFTGAGEEESIYTMVKLFNYLDESRSLTVEDASFNNGASVIAYGDKGASEQQWTLIPTEDEWFRLVNGSSEKVLGIYGGSTEEGGNAVQWEWDSSNNQQWCFVPAYKDGKTYYKFKNRNSGLFLTYGGDEIADGTAAYQAADDGSEAFLWDASISQGGDALTKLDGVMIIEHEKSGNSVDFALFSDSEKTCDAYVASYDAEGKLTKVDYRTVEIGEGETKTIGGKLDPDCSDYKVMVWEHGGVNPLTTSISGEVLPLASSGQDSDALYALDARTGKVTYSFSFVDNGSNDSGIMLGNSSALNTSSGNYFASGSIVLLFANGALYTRDSSAKTKVADYSVGERVGIKIVADIDANSYDLYVGGELKAESVAFRTAASEIDTLALVENKGGAAFKVYGFYAE